MIASRSVTRRANRLRIIFMGTPDFAVPILSEIMAAGHEVVAVYSQPARRAGRGMSHKLAPVHLFAEDSGLPVMTPKNFRDERESKNFADLACDVAVVAAYGLLLPAEVLEAPRFGFLNVHASALPRWRGAAPIQRAIMAGDKKTAVMIMRMEEGLDAGPICLSETVAIGPDMTAGELHDRLAEVGAGLIVRALAALERGSLEETPQSEDGVIYARKIEKSELQIDFSKPCAVVHNHIRGLSPFPGAWFEIKGPSDLERIKVLRSEIMPKGGGAIGEVIDDQLAVACADGAVRLLRVQRAGKAQCDAQEFLRGFPIRVGQRLNAS